MKEVGNMRKLQEQPGIGTDPNYLNGKLVDGQTVAGEGINQDIVQFFQKITEGRLTRNGLPDNETNGYQTLIGLLSYLRSHLTPSENTKGVAEIATTAEAQGETDDERIMTPKKVAESKKVTYTDDSGSDSLVRLREKIIEIGDWDMSTDSSVDVAHGLDASKIVFVEAFILLDGSSQLYNLLSGDFSSDLQGSVQVASAGNIKLKRTSGGFFDSDTLFNSTGYNRGYILIKYRE